MFKKKTLKMIVPQGYACTEAIFRWSGGPAAVISDRIAAGSRSNASTTFFRLCGHRWPEKDYDETVK